MPSVLPITPNPQDFRFFLIGLLLLGSRLTLLLQCFAMLLNNKARKATFVFFQMKRARIDDDFNPVYPYDQPNAPLLPFITPPFTSSDGLQEKPPGVLSLNYKNPITTQNGALTLKIGEGIDINDKGELTSNAVSVSPPLSKINNTLSLVYSDPLTVRENALHLKTALPISLNAARELTLVANAPLATTNGALQLQSAAPLGVAERTLKLLFSNPLYLQNNFLSVAVDKPLAMASTGAIALQWAPPLQVGTGGLTVATVEPLTVTNGNLNINTKRPLVIEDSSLYLAFRPPLRLFNSDPELGVNFIPPITIRDDGLALNTGEGLTLVRDRLSVNLGKDLQFVDNTVSLALSTALPLQYTDQLRLNIGQGLRYNPTSKKLDVDLNQNKGLNWEDNKVITKLGYGLQFDSAGNISVIPPSVTPHTLWTTADPSPNCSVYTDLDAKLWLSLVKCNGMVQGTIALKALKGVLLNPTASSISIVIYFYSNGVRRTNYPTFDNEGTLANTATWGYRQGESANTNVTNAVEFMPSSARYPINRGNDVQNQMMGYTCLQGALNMAVGYKVTFNHALEGYSLKFTWPVYNNQAFDVPCCSFSYITEE
ncbi:IV-2 [Simian mastadenovirus C]|uniref:IV-2 n=1 Tax=Simian mastadenovirus C TaxID=1962300 RepID=M9YZ57_9ADEN|nr:IV-2 [Simian mastadenovirus C]